jgi:hypothetical protein
MPIKSNEVILLKIMKAMDGGIDGAVITQQMNIS